MLLLLQGKERLLSQFEVEKREMTSQLEAEKAGQSALASQLDGSKTEARAAGGGGGGDGGGEVAMVSLSLRV